MPAGTSLDCRFNAIFDRDLRSWLEEYPWTKSEIALTWLTLMKCNVNSAAPPWWHHASLHSSRNNPGISWLWDLHLETVSHLTFVDCLQTFLECPKRCHRLSIGEASPTQLFSHLCVQIILNSCLGSTDLLNLRYFFLFLFVEHTNDMPIQVIFIAFMRCCQGF